ncbi:MAG: choice-of-anchor R domain-containing protein [Limisphaera sp.]
MKITRLVKATALVVALCVTPAHAGFIIFDSLNLQHEAGNLLDANTYAAQAFNSGTYTVLQAVRLNVYYDEQEGAPGNFDVVLRAATGQDGRPGSVVATLATGLPNPSSTDLNNIVSILGLNVSMSPNTTYYVAVQPNSGAFRWGYTSSENGVGLPSGWSYSQDAGTTWTAPDQEDPQRMMIEAVPEPSTWMAGSVALIAFLSMAIQRRRERCNPERSL